jgi:hypothetical protein
MGKNLLADHKREDEISKVSYYMLRRVKYVWKWAGKSFLFYFE